MQKLRSLLAICFLVATMPMLYAQDTHEILFISGRLVDEDSGRALANVHVVNLENRYGVSSDTLGYFRIPIEQKDTLRFSCIGYETAFVPAKTFLNKDTLVTLGLNPIAYTLNEANVMAWRWQNFKQEVLAMEIPEEEWTEKRWISNYFSEEDLDGLNDLPPGGITFGYSTKEDKQRAKLQEVMQRDRLWKKAEGRVNRKLVAKLTGLKDEKLDCFFVRIRYMPERIINMNDYDLNLFIKKRYKEYVLAQKDSVNKVDE